MKKTILTMSILTLINTVQAEFVIKIPLEQQNSGALPTGSIQFTNKQTVPEVPKENWVDTAPFFSDWVNSGEPLNCTNWTPDPNTVELGKTFTQTATDCQQLQIRTRQEQEIETNTSVVRNNGEAVVENLNIAATMSREELGTYDAWGSFADNNGLSKDWNYLSWTSKYLTYIPTESYPLTSVDRINLADNQLTNVDGFKNLSSVNGFFYINNNQLTNVDGLKNLTILIHDIALNNNKLTNLDGLKNLTSVRNIYLYNNNLTNINGLANVKSTGGILIDPTYSGPKLASTTRFCSLNAPSSFTTAYAQKTQLCNP